MLKTSAEIKQLSDALAKAQERIKDPERKGTGTIDGREYSYATLDAVMVEIRKAFAPVGLSLTQFPVTVEGKSALVTRISHSSGEFMEGALALPIAGLSPQDVGAVITYLRRYTASAAAGIAPEEDRDGKTRPAAPRAEPARPSAARESAVTMNPRGWDLAAGSPDGKPGCIKHQKFMKQSDDGKRWYCSAKDPAGRKGYCEVDATAADVAARREEMRRTGGATES